MKTSNRFCPSGLCLLVLVMLSAGLMRAETTLDAALNVGGGELEFSSYSTEDTNYPWTVLTEPGESHDGQSAARSGATRYYYYYSYSTYSAIYYRSFLSTSLTEPGMLSFWARGSGWGNLSLWVNGNQVRDIATNTGGSGEWRLYSVKLPLLGQSTVEWCFENRDSNSQAGQSENYFLLDEVRWQPADEQGFMYQLNEDGNSYRVQAYLGQDSEVSVPSQVDGKPVTSIGKKAFEGNENIIGV